MNTALRGIAAVLVMGTLQADTSPRLSRINDRARITQWPMMPPDAQAWPAGEPIVVLAKRGMHSVRVACPSAEEEPVENHSDGQPEHHAHAEFLVALVHVCPPV
jgi:hypothetical protein